MKVTIKKLEVFPRLSLLGQKKKKKNLFFKGPKFDKMLCICAKTYHRVMIDQLFVKHKE